jgi:sulfur-oxidizing protein SoxX
MRSTFRILSTALSTLALIGAIGISATASADAMDKGKKLAFNKKKGNCLACHMIVGGKQAGNIAPPLIAMKARFPDKAKLRAQIADPRAKNPDTMMPPFEAHGILSAKEINLITDYIHGL